MLADIAFDSEDLISCKILEYCQFLQEEMGWPRPNSRNQKQLDR